jgi:hypothetical protein
VARHGLPLIVPSEPLCGATAPVTLAGNLVVQIVDTMAGVMLTQLVKLPLAVFCSPGRLLCNILIYSASFWVEKGFSQSLFL